eukprot:CAMPEP_0170608096 /NCGR_PEP_ID=MMETSP0224-20130122/21403_1 /TAXON_ID=285029 /ORGANISM="Togula jolla, Strain CCCM 725" /LENGTH=583 /DNA_ID=CAMNT_0010933301 /DNA_START=37 /DNA_END=1788 /DNA_ORIENTATION=+
MAEVPLRWRRGMQQASDLAVGGLLFLPTVLLVLGLSGLALPFSEHCDAPDFESQALFDYATFFSCAEGLPVYLRFILLLVWLLLLISLLASTADSFFVPQLNRISHDLGLPEDVAGVTLLALGNGMPDVMTATSAIAGPGDFALTMGEFFGASNFIVSLVLGGVILCSEAPVRVHPMPFLRDTLAFFLVLLFTIYVSWDGYVGLLESVLFFVFYAAYVALVVLPTRFKSRGLRSSTDDVLAALAPDHEEGHSSDSAEEIELVEARAIPAGFKLAQDLESEASTASGLNSDFMLMESDSEATMMTDEEVDEEEKEADGSLEGLSMQEAEGLVSRVQLVMEFPFTVARHLSIPAADWNVKRRRLAMACPTFSMLVSLLGFGGWDAYHVQFGPLPLWSCSLLVGAPCALAICRCSSAKRRPRWHMLLLVMSLASTIGWFNLLANESVAVLETFGLKLGISSSTLGITVLAWGNCVGDLVADIALSRRGRVRMAVAGCFGSPMLSVMLGLGVALTSHSLYHGALHVELSLQNKVAAAFLLLSLATTICIFAVKRFVCPRWLAYVLFAEYAAFMLASILVQAGIGEIF